MNARGVDAIERDWILNDMSNQGEECKKQLVTCVRAG